jgi:hypothetical protein
MTIGDGFKLGAQSWAGAGSETTYGTEATVTSYVEFLSFNVNKEIEDGMLGGINTNGEYVKRYQGNVDVSGDLTFDFSPVDGTMLLKHMSLNNTVSSSGTSTTGYIHQFNPYNTTTGLIISGLTLKSRKGDSNIWAYPGCKINSAKFSGAPGEPIKVTYSFLGKDATTSSGGAPTYTAQLPFLFKDVVFRVAASIGVIATTSAIEIVNGFEITFDNALDSDSMHSLGLPTVYNIVPGNFRTAEISLTQRFDTSTSWSKFTVNTPYAVQVLLDSGVTCGAGAGATTYACAFNFYKAYYTGNDMPVDGAGVVMQTIPLRAIADSTTGYSWYITLTNDVASY